MFENTECQHLHWTSMQRTDGNPLHICVDCGDILTDREARAEHVTRDTISQTLGESICKALNINAFRVTSLRLTLNPGFPP